LDGSTSNELEARKINVDFVMKKATRKSVSQDGDDNGIELLEFAQVIRFHWLLAVKLQK
jgi:hypothetical protein